MEARFITKPLVSPRRPNFLTRLWINSYNLRQLHQTFQAFLGNSPPPSPDGFHNVWEPTSLDVDQSDPVTQLLNTELLPQEWASEKKLEATLFKLVYQDQVPLPTILVYAASRNLNQSIAILVDRMGAEVTIPNEAGQKALLETLRFYSVYTISTVLAILSRWPTPSTDNMWDLDNAVWIAQKLPTSEIEQLIRQKVANFDARHQSFKCCSDIKLPYRCDLPYSEIRLPRLPLTESVGEFCSPHFQFYKKSHGNEVRAINS